MRLAGGSFLREPAAVSGGAQQGSVRWLTGSLLSRGASGQPGLSAAQSLAGAGVGLRWGSGGECILAHRISWTEGPGRLQSTGSQRVGHGLGTIEMSILLRASLWIDESREMK